MTAKKKRGRKKPAVTTALVPWQPPPRRANWKPAFLEALSQTHNVTVSCVAVGIARQTAYYHRERDNDFKAKWEEALIVALETLEHAVWQTALAGDRLLMMFLLKAENRAKYQDRVAVEFNVREQARALAEKHGLDPDELIRVAEQITTEAAQQAGAGR